MPFVDGTFTLTISNFTEYDEIYVGCIPLSSFRNCGINQIKRPNDFVFEPIDNIGKHIVMVQRKGTNMTVSFKARSGKVYTIYDKDEANAKNTGFGRAEKGASTVVNDEVDTLIRRVETHPNNWYEILGIENTATPKDIKSAFRYASLKLHPDKCNAARAEEAFKKVNEAHSILIDSKQRETYDNSLLAAAPNENYNDIINILNITPKCTDEDIHKRYIEQSEMLRASGDFEELRILTRAYDTFRYKALNEYYFAVFVISSNLNQNKVQIKVDDIDYVSFDSALETYVGGKNTYRFTLLKTLIPTIGFNKAVQIADTVVPAVKSTQSRELVNIGGRPKFTRRRHNVPKAHHL